MRKLRTLYYRIKHVITYIPTLWKIYDFDAESLNTFSLAFFRRLKHALVNGYAEHEPKHLKALDLIIKLLETTDKTPFMDKHEAKWGELQINFIREPDSDFSRMVSSYPNAITEKEKQEATEEFSKLYNLDDYMKDKKIRLAYSIYLKYYRYLWD